jgi:deazaflavin-dependent oxidoreductase (nitroreductase family)
MPFARSLSRCTRGRVNTVFLRFAGRAAFADLEHVGRVSGTVRHTPLRAFRTSRRVVVGLNFGPDCDWLRNCQAAGRCRMRLGREQLELGAPRVVPVEQGTRAMPWLFGVALKHLAHTTECVEWPVLTSASVATSCDGSQPARER